MKFRYLALLSVCLFLFSCESPTTSEPPEPPAPKANMVLDGDFTKSMTSYDCPRFSGYIKNIGNGVGYNCMIEIRAFSDTGKNTIIDTANGFPGNLGNIDPGQRAFFEAIFFDLDSLDQIVAYDYEITWLDR